MSRRWWGVPAAAVAALAWAASAGAAGTGSVSVSVAGATTTIHVASPQADPPVAAVNIYVPDGVPVTLGQAAGTTIGSIPSATAYSYDNSLTLPLVGAVVVADPASVPDTSKTPCIGSATPAAVWTLNLSVAGQTIQLPLYVLQTSGAETALGAYKLVVCLAPPDVPAGTPGRSPMGAQLLDAQLAVKGVFGAPAGGSATWETLLTPYNPGVGTVDLAGTYEARALVASGGTTLTTKLNRKTHVLTLGGRAAVGGEPFAGAVTIYRGSSAKALKAAATANASSGAWTARVKLKGKKPVYLQARFSSPQTTTACSPALPASVAPAGCAGATVGAVTAASRVVRVKP